MVDVIVFENRLFLLANKPHNLPTVPLKAQKNVPTLLSIVSEKCPVVLDVHGKNEWEGSALHRLDTATSGLVLFAKTQEFYDYMTEVQDSDRFVKTYVAICDEHCAIKGCSISSYFRSFGPGAKMVKAEQDAKKADSPRLYTTGIKRVGNGIYECTLTRGFRHQIRVHLSTNGCPIIGDALYNPDSDSDIMELNCTAVSFPMPDGSSFSYCL